MLPDPETALRNPDGLAGICTDLSVPVLLEAYAKGLFPLAHVGPQKWWAPAERMVSFPDEVHIAKNVRRLLELADRHVIVEKGRCVWQGPGAELRTRPELVERHLGV